MVKPAAKANAGGKAPAPVTPSERGAMDKLASYASGTAITGAASTPAAVPKKAGKIVLPWTCDGCDRVYKSVAGVKYHRDQNVCRPSRNSPAVASASEAAAAAAPAAAVAASSSAASSIAAPAAASADAPAVVPAAITPAEDVAADTTAAAPAIVTTVVTISKTGRAPRGPQLMCDICEKSHFKSVKALRYHKENLVCVRRAEKDAKDRVKRGGKGVAVYACPSCPKNDFRSKQALDYHVTNKVCVRPVLQCSKCGKFDFHSRQAFKYHVDKSVCVRKAEQDEKSLLAKRIREAKAREVLARRETAELMKNAPLVCDRCKKSDFKSKTGLKKHTVDLVCVTDKDERQGIIDKRARDEAAASAAAALASAAHSIVGKGTAGAITASERAVGKATNDGQATGAPIVKSSAILVDDKGKPLFMCGLCESASFKSTKALRYHVENKVCVRRAERVRNGSHRRGPNEVLACPRCSKDDFRSRKALQYHTEHNVCVRAPLMCILCDKQDFKSRNAFKYHIEHKVCERRNHNSAVKAAMSAADKKSRAATIATIAASAPASASAVAQAMAAASSSASSSSSAVAAPTPTPMKSPVVLVCDLCGKDDFNSRNAFKYHAEHKVCVRRAEKRALQAAAGTTPDATVAAAETPMKKRRTGPGSAAPLPTLPYV
jgi:hypothetical protein